MSYYNLYYFTQVDLEIVPSRLCIFTSRMFLDYSQSKALCGPNSNLPLCTSIQTLNCNILTAGSSSAFSFLNLNSLLSSCLCPFLTFTTQFRWFKKAFLQDLRVSLSQHSGIVFYSFTGIASPLNEFLEARFSNLPVFEYPWVLQYQASCGIQ